MCIISFTNAPFWGHPCGEQAAIGRLWFFSMFPWRPPALIRIVGKQSNHPFLTLALNFEHYRCVQKSFHRIQAPVKTFRHLQNKIPQPNIVGKQSRAATTTSFPSVVEARRLKLLINLQRQYRLISNYTMTISSTNFTFLCYLLPAGASTTQTL